MKTYRLATEGAAAPQGVAIEEATPFHEPREEEEIMAAKAGLSTGSREEGPSQQES